MHRINEFLSGILKIVVLVFMVIGLAYLGACAYANFIQNRVVNAPDSNKAQYEVVVTATGTTLYSDEVLQNGAIIKLEGYFEMVDGKWRYRDGEITLDQDIFGKIVVRRR